MSDETESSSAGEQPVNNGILEGLNSIVQAAKAKARGYKTFQNFRIIVFLLTGDLNFKSLNPLSRLFQLLLCGPSVLPLAFSHLLKQSY